MESVNPGIRHFERIASIRLIKFGEISSLGWVEIQRERVWIEVEGEGDHRKWARRAAISPKVRESSISD